MFSKKAIYTFHGLPSKKKTTFKIDRGVVFDNDC